MTKGIYPREEKRLRGTIFLDGGARAFRITHDPSGYFRNGLFRLSDVQAGGFDPGTTFVHVHDKRLKYVVNATGVARKVIEKKREQKAGQHKLVTLTPNGNYRNSSSAATRTREQ